MMSQKDVSENTEETKKSKLFGDFLDRAVIKNYLVIPARLDIMTQAQTEAAAKNLSGQFPDNKEKFKIIGNKKYRIHEDDIEKMVDYWEKLYQGMPDQKYEFENELSKEYFKLKTEEDKNQYINEKKHEWILQSKHAQRARYTLDYFFEKPGDQRAKRFYDALYESCRETTSYDDSLEKAEIAPSE